jgi:alpha-galactosidase/6-phospho-beta-glucosidase family protein
VLGAAGDRHLAEFVPWYLRSEEELHRWGAVLTPSSYRLDTRPIIPSKKRLSPEDLKVGKLERSDEEGTQQILALLGLGDLDTNVNLPNQGQIADLPLGAVVETNAQFRKDSLVPVTAPRLPAPLAALVRRVSAVQQMTLGAAMEGNRELAVQAVLNDPLVTIPTDKARKMFLELLRANDRLD